MIYVAIEHNSGYVWGTTTTSESPESACSMIAWQANPTLTRTVWGRVDPIRDTNGGYHLYAMPAGFPDIEDGTDAEMIRRVENEGRHIGDYRMESE